MIQRYLILYLGFLCGNLYSQSHFSKVISTNDDNYTSHFVGTKDGGSFITANDIWGKGEIFKFNQSGMLDWAYYLQPPPQQTYTYIATVMEFDSLSYFSGSLDTSVYLFCLDHNHNKIWSKSYHEPFATQEGAVSITTDSANIYLLCTLQPFASLNNHTNFPGIIKLDRLGNIIWCKVYQIPLYPQDIAYNPTSGKITFISGFDQVVLDTAGNIQSAYTHIQGAAFKICSDNGTGFITSGYDLSGRPYISKTNGSGLTLWSTNFRDTALYGFVGSPSALLSASDGSYYIGSAQNSNGQNPACTLTKFDNAGNSLWCKGYFGSSANVSAISGLSEKANGEISFGGHRPSISEDPFFISTDTSGQIPCDFTTIYLYDSTFNMQDSAISPFVQNLSLVFTNVLDSMVAFFPMQQYDCVTGINESALTEYSNSFILFPNPSDGNFQLIGNFSNGSILRLYDMLGKEVADPIELPEGNNSITINLNLVNGIYFYQIISGSDFLHEEKFVILK